MTIYCVLCKKESIPGDRSRSFHKFPDDENLKRIWMDFAGINSVTKYTKLCSDHFHKSAYEDSNEYKKKRCLLKSTVPCKLVDMDRDESDRFLVAKDQPQSNSETKTSEKTIIMNMTGNCVSPSSNDLLINTLSTLSRNQLGYSTSINDMNSNSPVAVSLDLSSNFVQSHSDNTSHIPSNLKRSFPLCDISDVSPNKRLRLCNEFEAAVTETQSIKVHTHTNLKRAQVIASHSDESHPPSKKLCLQSVIESSPPRDVGDQSEPNASHKTVKRRLSCEGVANVPSTGTKLCSSNEIESSPAEVTKESEPNADCVTMKRKSSSIEVSNIPPTKKFRFFDGSQPMHISREDFASDDAWTRFLKFTIYKNRQAESCRKKNERKKKRIGSIKELISELREENAKAAADYLQVT